MADQNLSLGTIFTGDTRQIERALTRLRSILTGLANAQGRAARQMRAGMEGGRMTLYGDLEDVYKMMGNFEKAAPKFSAQVREAMRGITDPTQLKAIASQYVSVERNLGKVLSQMGAGSDAAQRLNREFDRTGAVTLTAANSLRFLNGQFVANDNAGRDFLRTQGLADVVSQKFTSTLQKQIKATQDVRVQYRDWLRQFAYSPAIYEKAKTALMAVDKAAGGMAAQMIATGKNGEQWYRTLPKTAIATKMLGEQVQIVKGRFAAADFEGKNFLEGLKLGGVYTNQFAAKLRELGGSSDWVGKQIGRVRGGIERLAAAFKVTASYAIAGGAIMAFRSAVIGTKDAIYEYNQGLANLAAITQATEPEIRMMGTAIKKVAQETKYSTTEVADAMVVLGQAGLDAGQSVDAIKAVAILATGTLEKMENTADLLTTTLTSFNMAASESGRIADVMANAINRSKLTVEKFRTSFNYIAPVAHLAGLSLEDTAAAMEILANAGLKGSTIGTSFRQVLQRLIAPTADLREAFTAAGADFTKLNPKTASLAEIFDELGRVVPNASKAFELFGVRAAPAVAAFITAGRAGFEEYLADLYKVGSAEEMAEKQMKGLMVQAKNLGDRVKLLAVEVGEGGLASAFHLLYAAARPVIQLMTDFAKNEIGRVIIAFAGLTATIVALYQAFRFLKVVALAALIPDKTISDIKRLARTGETSTSIFYWLGQRLLQLGKIIKGHPLVTLVAILAGAAYALKSWNDALKRSLEQSEEHSIVLGKQVKQLDEYSKRIVKNKDNHIAFQGTVQRLIRDFPELEASLKAAGDDWEKIVKHIDEYKKHKVWEAIVEEIKQMEKLNEVTERQIKLRVLWDRLIRGAEASGKDLWDTLVELKKRRDESRKALKEGIVDTAKGVVGETKKVLEQTPLGKLLGKWMDFDNLKKEFDKEFNAIFGPLIKETKKIIAPTFEEMDEAVKQHGANTMKNLQTIGAYLQKEFKLSATSSISEITDKLIEMNDAAAPEDKLNYTREQWVNLAVLIKSKWKEIAAAMQTYRPKPYEEMDTAERLRMQADALRRLSPEWMEYYHAVSVVQKPLEELRGILDGWMPRVLARDAEGMERINGAMFGFQEVYGDFSDLQRTALAQAALDAKTAMDKMEKDAKETNMSQEQIMAERVRILRKYLQKYIEEVDKWRKIEGYRDIKMTDFLPKVSKPEFGKWAKELFGIDVNVVGKEMADKLFQVYQSGMKIVKMRDLPDEIQKKAQEINQQLGKDVLQPDDWVFPQQFTEFGNTVKVEIKKASDEIEKAFQDAADKYGLSVDLIRSVAYEESKYMKNPPDAGKGAIGIMQLMPYTAKEMEVDANDWYQNVMGGAKYLKKMIEKANGDIAEGVAMYQAGPKGVRGPVNRGYVERVLSHIGQLTPVMMNKYLMPFMDLTKRLETEQERLARLESAPVVAFTEWNKEVDKQLQIVQEQNEEYAQFMTEGFGKYGSLWEEFVQKQFQRMASDSPRLREAIEDMFDVKLSEEDWARNEQVIMQSADAVDVFRKILLLTGIDAAKVEEVISAVFKQLYKDFEPVAKKAEETEEAIRSLWKELQAEHDIQLGFATKEQADIWQYQMNRIRGEFNRGQIDAKTYADKILLAQQTGVISYEEYERRIIAATKDGWDNFKYGLEEATNKVQTFGEMWQQIGTEIIDVIAEGLTGAIMDFIDGTKSAKEAFIDFAKEVLKWIAKILMETAIRRALSSIVGGFHTGGVVGEDKPSAKRVLRFHKGYSGLAADEVPAILKKNESVFTPAQMKALGGMISQGSTTSITVPVSVAGDTSGRLANRLRSNIEDVVRRTLREEMR